VKQFILSTPRGGIFVEAALLAPAPQRGAIFNWVKRRLQPRRNWPIGEEISHPAGVRDPHESLSTNMPPPLGWIGFLSHLLKLWVCGYPDEIDSLA